jgi:hypothetical protein
LFDWTGIFVPKGCRWDGVAQQGRVLVKPSKGLDYQNMIKHHIRGMHFLCCP